MTRVDLCERLHGLFEAQSQRAMYVTVYGGVSVRGSAQG